MIGKIASQYVENKIENFSNDSVLFIDNVMYCDKSVGKKNKSIAYVPLDKVTLMQKSSNKKQINIIKIESNDNQTAHQSNDNDAVNERSAHKDRLLETTNNTDKNHTLNEATNNKKVTEHILYQGNIIDSSFQLKSTNSLYVFLKNTSHKNLLAFNSNEERVSDKEKCYIFVADDNNVVAVLSKGKNNRINLLTGAEVINFKKEYVKYYFIWVYVY